MRYELHCGRRLLVCQIDSRRGAREEHTERERYVAQDRYAEKRLADFGISYTHAHTENRNCTEEHGTAHTWHTHVKHTIVRGSGADPASKNDDDADATAIANAADTHEFEFELQYAFCTEIVERRIP